jgi:hypothetical protein
MFVDPMNTLQLVSEEVGSRGFAIVEDVLSHSEAELLLAELNAVGQREGIQRRGGVLAVRNLLEVAPSITRLARSDNVYRIAAAVLGPAASP